LGLGFGFRVSVRSFDKDHALIQAGAQPALHFWGSNFHELSFDDVILLIQPWYNFFTNGHRYVLLATFPKMRLISLIRPVTRGRNPR